MKATREVIASDRLRLPSTEDHNGFDSRFAVDGQRPAIRRKLYSGKLSLQLKSLCDLAGLTKQRHSEPGQATPGGLLTNDWNLCTVFTQIRSDREQQRTGSGNNDAFPANGKAGLHHCLQAADTGDIRQGPSWKWQESLPRSSC